MTIDPNNYNVDAVLDKIADAGGLDEYDPSLPAGNHSKLAFASGRIRSTREYGNVIEMAMVVLESDSATVGAKYGEAFFIDKTGLEGTYNRKRFNAFAEAIAKSCSVDHTDESVMKEIRRSLLDPTAPFRGVLFRAVSRDKTTKNGKQVVNSSFSELPNTRESMDQTRAWLDQNVPMKVETAKPSSSPSAPPQQVAPSTPPTSPAPQQPVASTGLLGNMFGGDK